MSQHPIVHIEIPADNPAAASKFYADAFGWKIMADPVFDYHMFDAEGGPGGGFVPTTGTTDGGTMTYKPDSLLVYISTDDIDASLAKVESLGGKTLVPKTEIPNTGWFAVFSDPTGNRVALYTSIPH